MKWLHSDPYTYKSGLWTITVVIEKGIPKWSVWKDGKQLVTRRNLINAKQYAEDRQE